MKKIFWSWIFIAALASGITACGGHKNPASPEEKGSPPRILSVYPKSLASGETTTLTILGEHLTPGMELQLGNGVMVQGKIIVTGKGHQAVAAVAVDKGVKPAVRKLRAKNEHGEYTGRGRIAITQAETRIAAENDAPLLKQKTELSVYRENIAEYGSFPTWPTTPGYFTDTFIPSGKKKDLAWSFRWSTTVPRTSNAVWQVSTEPFTADRDPGPNWRTPEGFVAFGTRYSVPRRGKQAEFTIDFSKFVAAPPADLPYNADEKKFFHYGAVKAMKASSKISGAAFALPGYRTYYVRIITLDDDGNPVGQQSNLVAARYGSYDEYYSSNFSSPELTIDSNNFSKSFPTFGTEFPDRFVRTASVATDSTSAGGGWPSRTAWFRWKAPMMKAIRSTLWQVSSTPFSAGREQWTNPPGLLDSGVTQDHYYGSGKKEDKHKFNNDGFHYFSIDFTNALSMTQPSPKQTMYLRAVALDKHGRIRGRPSQQVTFIVDNTKQASPWVTIKTVPVSCTGLTVEILGYTPQRLPDSDFNYYYVLVKNVPPGNHMMDGLMWLSNYKKGDYIYIPPKDDDKNFWDYVGDAFSAAFNLIKDLANWASSAWDSVKGYVLKAITSALSKTGLVDCGAGTTCSDLFSAALDAGMLACGIPPTLPNFDMIADMGRENLVKMISAQVAEQCGLPEDLTRMTAEQLMKNEQIKKVASDTADSLLAQAQQGADNYYLLGGYLKPAPERFDRPAMIMLKITNKGAAQSKRAKIAMSDSLMFFKSFTFNIPPLLPGESMSTSVVLEQDFSHVYDDAYSCSRPYHECHPQSGYVYAPRADWWLQYRQMHDDFSVRVVEGSCDCNDQIAKLKQQEDHASPNTGYAYVCTAAGSSAALSLDKPAQPWGMTNP
jgi:hypothetical protein